MSNQEKRRLERLKKELDSQQKKLDAEKLKYQRQMKELKAEQNKLAAQKRELATKQKKFKLAQQQTSNSSSSRKSKISTGSSGIENKLRQEIKDMKSKSEKTKKDLRETRKDLDAANDEIKILKRKLKHASQGNNSNADEKRLKQARREIFNMKRRLKIALRDLDKQAKYYESQLRRFKLDEQRWIKRQREINNEKSTIIKYVFIDDVAKIKLYKENRTRCRIKTREGAEIILKDIEIVDATDYDEIADEVLDALVEEIQLEFGKRKKGTYNNYGDSKKKIKRKKRKKGAKGGGDKGDGDGDGDGNDEEEYEEEEDEENVDENGGSPVFDEEDDLKDFDDALDDNTEDFIGQCFNELMKELTERTRDLNKLNQNEDAEILLDAVKERHKIMESALTKLNYDYIEEVPEMNQNWQNEIYVIIKEKQNPKQDEQDIDDILHRTLAARNEVLQKVIDVLNDQQPKALLDEIIENNDEEDETWRNILGEMGKIKMNLMNNVNNGSKINSNELMVSNELIAELQSRLKDLESLRQLNQNDMEPAEEIENILEDVKKRHVMEMERLTQLFSTDGDEENKEEEDNELLDNIGDNNREWEEEIVRLIDENKQNVKNKQQNQYYADELNGRIADLLKLIDIYKITQSTKPDRKSLKRNFNSFVTSIKDRQRYNNENFANDQDLMDNDRDWKDNMFSLASDISGLKVSDITNDNADDNEEDGNTDENKENETFDPKNWWLDKDENRNDTVDNINVDEQQCGELFEAVTYVDRLLYNREEKEDDNDVVTSCYFPVPQIFEDNTPNKHNMIATLYDGVVLCKLINRIKPDYIDERCVHQPNAFNPFPISDEKVRDNMQLVISCAQSMGIQLKSYELDEWLDDNNWVQYIIDLINALSTVYINKRIGIHKSKELVRLVKNNEDNEEIRKLSGQQWLQRWVNYLNSKPVKGEIPPENYNDELFTATKLNNDEIEEFSAKPQAAADAMIAKYKSITNIQAEDLCNNNRKLQDLFAADLFEAESTLDKLTDQEKSEYKSLLRSSSKGKSEIDTFTTWINTALSPDITVLSLLKDLSSGYILLKLLDKANPGCVNWRQARKKIRHKFDKVNNCNMVMKLCEEFGFSLVGMAGSDIVDSNEKFVVSLLSQLMRYYTTRQLSLLLFKNATHDKKKQKAVTDGDILQWVNLKINECDDAQSKPISSFKDRVLSTCIFYIELLKAVRPDHVDLTLCNYDVKPLINAKVMDKQKVERQQNARYCMTLIRRFGGELFVIPHHLCIMEYKAILAVFAAIMTISMSK